MLMKKIFKNGILVENPTFIGFLGMCPTLATTKSLESAVGMALATILVLVLSNIIISLIKTITPSEIRIPVYIVVIATLVKSAELLIAAYVPSVYSGLGIYLPLIVVNCIVLGRAEAFAAKNSVGKSAIDGLATGIGFLLALSLIGFTREFLGTGAIQFNSFLDQTQSWIKFRAFDEKYALSLLAQPMGAFLTLGLLAGIITTIKLRKEDRQKRALVAAKAPKAMGVE